MITSLVIENFKAIKHLEIILEPFTVLIGDNSSGKSSVLQALDFIRAFAIRDIDEYLNERGWSLDELKSQFTNNGIAISVGLTLVINDKPQMISWSIAADVHDGRIVSHEIMRNTSSGKVVLARGNEIPSTPENIEAFYLNSSFLKLIDENSPSLEFPEELYAVKKFFVQSSSYELLAPDKMREKGSRGEVKDIGLGGEKLAAYINRLSTGRINKLNKTLSEFVGYTVKTTTETKRPGWVDLYFNECFSETKTKIKAAHTSDGLLRLLALITASLPEDESGARQMTLMDSIINIPDSGFLLLDEIEDGINPYLTGKVVSMLRMIVSDSNKQVIVTTHSPVMVNHFDHSEIVFMWRNGKGQIESKKMFESEGMQDTLDCFNPGEVWLNYTKDEIIDMMDSCKAGEDV
jgi:predicted ATPase